MLLKNLILPVEVIEEGEQIELYDGLILPGVGAFQDGMNGLAERGFIAAIQKYLALNRPLLGICLGMQLLFESSEEFGYCRGLGLIEGTVNKLPDVTVEQEPQRIPHIGWSHIVANNHQIFSNLMPMAEYYFCHSYAAYPRTLEHRIAHYYLGGHSVLAAVNKNQVYGFQFHPEKSGKAGLKLIENFLQTTKLL